ncbi:MAG: hypothetical protein R3Y50_08755 [Rikenellaceae bacterium]
MKDQNKTMIKIQIKSIFDKVLFEYEKENNTIKDTLVEAIKSGADLRDADLRYADLDKRYLQVSCIGSSKRTTTYCFEDDKIWCGCFKGSLEEFEKQVKETHKNNKQFLDEYMGFINYVKFLQE